MDTFLISRAVSELGECLRIEENVMATAESCTGGLLANTLTNTPGSSEWFAGGLVAYSDEVKIKLLGVKPALIEKHGAVSRQVVLAMAEGALKTFNADIAIAVSGIAGPAGGTRDKPVGTVWMAWAYPGGSRAKGYSFEGDREIVKDQSVMAAINGLLAVAR